jgi:hypothetical protein
MKIIALIMLIAIVATGCNNNDDDSTTFVNVDFNFTHNWDGSTIENSDFELTEYSNAHGEVLTLSKLDYLISDITFTASTGDIYDAGDFNLVSVREGVNLTFTPNIQIPPGEYRVSFTFGLDDEDNIDGAYPELNTPSVAWGVPLPLGGGYHYMRMEGKYTNPTNPIPEVGFAYHTIRANDMNTTPLTLQDTSFEVDLGQVTISNSTNIEIKMNAAEWFKNPNLWDLNVLFATLMPNFNAQVMMSQNGQNGVFSLGTVTQ